MESTAIRQLARNAATERGLGIADRAQGYLVRVRQLGLERYVTELDINGYTVIPPHMVAPQDLIERITAALLRVAQDRTGVEHQLGKNGSYGRRTPPLTAGLLNHYVMFYLLFEDPVFEEWLENPVLQALVDYVMRGEAQVSSYTSHVKWKDGRFANGLGLHTDTPASPEGLVPATHDNACNSVLTLTDYSRENGALAVVPGSHLLFRSPRPGEGEEEATPVEAPAGSLIFWHGATWHGGYPKQTDGLRLNLTTYFCNRALKTQELYQREVPPAMLDRHSTWFARVLGADDAMGWTQDGPQPTYLPDTRLSSRALAFPAAT